MLPVFSDRNYNGDKKDDVLDRMRTQTAALEHKNEYGDKS